MHEGATGRAQTGTESASERKLAASKETVRSYLLAAAETHTRAAQISAEAIARAAQTIAESLRSGGKLLICGNGGSAAQCQHMAAELVSLLNKQVQRPAIAALALTTDSSILTAIGNDFGFENVFARQVEALGRQGDVLLVISTSGMSENALHAAEIAKRKGLRVIALVGKQKCPLAQSVHRVIHAPSIETQHIQEAHLAMEHVLCVLVEEALSEEEWQ